MDITNLHATIKGIPPSKSNCYKIITLKGKDGKSHASLSKSDAMKKYEQDFYIQLPPHLRNINLDCFFEFHINVYYPSQRSDLDNSLKGILDILQFTKTIKNDNKCVSIHAYKALDKDNPRVEFKIVPVAIE